jgi:adenylate cyclase
MISASRSSGVPRLSIVVLPFANVSNDPEQAANPRLYYVHMHLAAAFGLKGNFKEAKLELAESIRLKPEYNTFKRYVASWASDPKIGALHASTLLAGLRNAGMPDE